MTAKIHAEKRQAKGNEEMERILLEQAEKLLLSETGKITDTEEFFRRIFQQHWISLRFRVRLWMAMQSAAGILPEYPARIRHFSG